MYVYGHVCRVCMYTMCQVLIEDVGSPGAGVIGDHELLNRSWELNSGLPEQPKMLLIMEPSFQP